MVDRRRRSLLVAGNTPTGANYNRPPCKYNTLGRTNKDPMEHCGPIVTVFFRSEVGAARSDAMPKTPHQEAARVRPSRSGLEV